LIVLASTSMASVALIEYEFQLGVSTGLDSESALTLNALNLSMPTRTNQRKLLQVHAKADARKTSQALGKAADTAALSTPLGLETPPGLSLPDWFTPPPGLAQPTGLACPKRSKAGKCQKKGVSASDYSVESDAEGTSTGTGSITGSGSSDREDTEPEGEEFQMKANASFFVPGVLSHSLPSKTTCGQQKTPLRTPLRGGAGFFVPGAARMALPVGPVSPVDELWQYWSVQNQVQQGGQRCSLV